jgi:hypothetical protein
MEEMLRFDLPKGSISAILRCCVWFGRSVYLALFKRPTSIYTLGFAGIERKVSPWS